ncbi:MAG: hypothetical protein KIT09_34210 [Bryobacteraceae bacterium]|nr:hypothetical protein [Bryobacteraceae bacterium]
MSVINPRNKLVNFRLSESEFDRLRSACLRQGARSVSEYARASVLRGLEEPASAVPAAYGRLSMLDQKVAELEIRMEQLLRLIGAAGRTLMTQVVALPLAGDAADLASRFGKEQQASR